jgi:hypothetical protein
VRDSNYTREIKKEVLLFLTPAAYMLMLGPSIQIRVEKLLDACICWAEAEVFARALLLSFFNCMCACSGKEAAVVALFFLRSDGMQLVSHTMQCRFSLSCGSALKSGKRHGGHAFVRRKLHGSSQGVLLVGF